MSRALVKVGVNRWEMELIGVGVLAVPSIKRRFLGWSITDKNGPVVQSVLCWIVPVAEAVHDASRGSYVRHLRACMPRPVRNTPTSIM